VSSAQCVNNGATRRLEDAIADPRHRALQAVIELLHPAPIAVVLVAATGFCAAAVRGRPPARRLGPLLIAISLTQLAISIHNDYCDRGLDAATKPWRMIPRGALSPRAAITAAGAFVALGLLIAVPLGGVAVALVALGTSAGLAYNAYFKRSVWTWLPFWIALPTLPVCAFVAMRRFQPRLCLAYLLGAPLVLGVYLADTLSDLESDRAHGIRGLAQTLGPGPARLACWISVASAIVLALATREKRDPPGPLYPLAIGLLGIAPVVDCRRHLQLHWVAIMGSVVAIALGWLNDLAATQESA
jgi:geranylgeranylglycerol-phosphate geranylgeranyltransferase